MISFHPTISPIALGKYLWQSRSPVNLTANFTALFPDHHTKLVDSGRSALAVVIETLNLQGQTLLVPAYVCDVLYPVFHKYDIKPIFLDVDPETYQPSLPAYTDEVLAKVDAVFLVATYGQQPDNEIVKFLQDRGINIIEDYAGRSPFYNDPLTSAARIYSLPKTLPVPDGGLAIVSKSFSKDTIASPLAAHNFSIGFIKNVLKLLPGVAPLIARIRNNLQTEQAAPTWDGIHAASKLTKTILADYLSIASNTTDLSPYTYCLPYCVDDPDAAIERLRKNGVSAERIWQRPIVANLDVQEAYELRAGNYPVTFATAKRIICAPLWHVKSDEDYKNYLSLLNKFCEN